MSTIPQTGYNVLLLACIVDHDDTANSYYRILVDNRHVKYLTTTPHAFRGFQYDRTLPTIVELLPPPPHCAWNTGIVAHDPETGKAAYVRTEMLQLPSVQNVWHPVTFNEDDLLPIFRLRQRVYTALHPDGSGRIVLVKLAVWPWEVPAMEQETAAYQWLNGSGVGPQFLGHLAEGASGGRIVGFVAEWMDSARPAGPQDLVACRMALGRLHMLRIELGDINRHNFLVRDGHGDVVLVDFETAERDCSLVVLENEMRALESSLADTSNLGGLVRG